MIAQVGHILIDKIKTLPFIDKYAGVIKVLSYTQLINNKSVKKLFPADCQVTMQQCEQGRYKDLIPDSDKKSILYLEEAGPAIRLRTQGPLVFWKASYNLVCWLNMPLLGFSDCSYSAIAIQGIISRIPITPFNNGIYQRVNIKIVSQQPKNNNPFTKYSYDEAVTQYLMYPYDYFVLSVDVEFAINKRCVDETPIGEPLNCIKK